MIDEAIKEKLRDPAYFELHAKAFAAIRDVGRFSWYDSDFLRQFEAAKMYLAMVRPDALDDFIDGFTPIRSSSDFAVSVMDEVFDETTRQKILDISRTAKPDNTSQDAYERENFGRYVIWDHPFYLELQKKILPTVSDVAGQELEPGYNFLSLYGGAGKCDPHMDQPVSMFTLDYCIEQSDEWPIYFSKIVDWPTMETVRDWDNQSVKEDPALEFEEHILQPNQALLFNGSSQWHYREAIPKNGFCSLLFFHYFPAGCRNLVEPSGWTDHFNIPELAPFCELVQTGAVEGPY